MSLLSSSGGARNFPTGGDASDEGAKIRFSGYHRCKKNLRKIIFHLPKGSSMFQRGAIVLPWRHHCSQVPRKRGPTGEGSGFETA